MAARDHGPTDGRRGCDRCRKWVKSGKTRNEHLTSALLPKAASHGRFATPALCHFLTIQQNSKARRGSLDTRIFVPDSIEERRQRARRLEVMNALRRRHIGNKLPVLRRQIAMAERDDLIARQRAAPKRAAFWPALRIGNQALDQSRRHSPVVREKRQIDVDQSVSSVEPLPG
jgi:hypothetical protein